MAAHADDYWEWFNTVAPYIQGVGQDDIINRLGEEARNAFVATGDGQFIEDFITEHFVFPERHLDRAVTMIENWIRQEQEDAMEEQEAANEEIVMNQSPRDNGAHPPGGSPVRGRGKVVGKGKSNGRTWIEALKLWNSSRSHWCIPKKGTKEYNQVYRLMKKKSA